MVRLDFIFQCDSPITHEATFIQVCILFRWDMDEIAGGSYFRIWYQDNMRKIITPKIFNFPVTTVFVTWKGNTIYRELFCIVNLSFQESYRVVTVVKPTKADNSQETAAPTYSY